MAEGQRPTPEPPDTPEPLRAEEFRRIAEGGRPLGELIDPERGFVIVEYHGDASGEDPRADADGVIRRAMRVCGSDARAEAERLARDLRLRAEESSFDPTFECHDLVCTHPAEMEYDLMGTYRFRRGSQGTLRLDSVERIEGGPVTEEWVREAERWARTQRERLSDGTCPD